MVSWLVEIPSTEELDAITPTTGDRLDVDCSVLLQLLAFNGGGGDGFDFIRQRWQPGATNEQHFGAQSNQYTFGSLGGALDAKVLKVVAGLQMQQQLNPHFNDTVACKLLSYINSIYASYFGSMDTRFCR